MTDYQTIMNAVSSFFAAVDRCDWDAVRGLMTESFRVDYSSYTGDPASDVTPEQLTGAWAELMPWFDAAHHQIGNQIVEIDGDGAVFEGHGMATHFIADAPGGDLEFIVGTYRIMLVRSADAWRLSGMTFNFQYKSGNADLDKEARRRAEAA